MPNKLLEYLYYGFVIFLPLTKISIPLFGGYEITAADFFLLASVIMLVLSKPKIRKEFTPILFLYLLFLFSITISVLKADSFVYYMLELLPFMFGAMIILSLISTINKINSHRIIINTFYLLTFSLLISVFPILYQIVFGIEPALFYDPFGWRYSFLSIQPNQFGVSTNLFLMLACFISLKFKPEYLVYLLLVSLLLFLPVFYSGSKTTTLVHSFLTVVLTLIVIGRLNVHLRLVGLSVIFLLMFFSYRPLAQFVSTQQANVSRAFSVYEKISEVQKFGIDGDTGETIEEGLQIFHQNPIYGIGIGNARRFTRTNNEVHNSMLSIMSGAGLIGTTGMLIFFGWMFLRCQMSNKRRLLKFFVVIIFMAFFTMNLTHMLLRQRWVWYFLTMLVIISLCNNEEYKFRNQKISKELN